ncbi:MAG: phosphoglycerate dehydrogenase [Chloroflexi bacterium]|nr:phosphoglycerate dehydrogenase [Chloroflexota bacterium]
MADRWQILVATDLTDESLALLRGAPQVAVQTATPTLAAVREQIASAHALISRDDVPVDATLLDHAPLLRVIGRVGASVGNVDIEAVTRRGIIVMNTPGANAIAAAEHTLALMLALSRKLIVAHNSLREGWWLLDRKQQRGTQLHGKTLGLIGLGRVGSRVARGALALGMTVLAADPYIGEDQATETRVTLVGLRELLRRSDFVSLHVPVTSETRGLVDAAFIEQMQPGARLINTAHGSVIGEEALAAALKSGRIAGAAVDVFNEEPPYHSPLIGLEQIVHTPHIGDNTIEATQDLSREIAQQVLDALNDHDYRNAVNMPFQTGVNFAALRPYLLLAERMGSLFDTLARHPVMRVAIECRGEDTATLIKPLTVALLRGC